MEKILRLNIGTLQALVLDDVKTCGSHNVL